MIPSHHELLPMQRAHACLGGGNGGYGMAERLSPGAESMGGTASRPPWDPGHTGACACNHLVLIVISPIRPYYASS